MLRTLALTLLFGSMATAAHAVMPPHVYAQARREAPDLMVFRVIGVEAPSTGNRNIGHCRVRVQVLRVERGATYRPGQVIVLPVLCVNQAGQVEVPDGGGLYEDMMRLMHSQYGRAWLVDGRPVLDQYDILLRP
jgi:hypothetical protein